MVQLVSDCTTICLIFTFQIPFLSFSNHISHFVSSWLVHDILFKKVVLGIWKNKFSELCCLCTELCKNLSKCIGLVLFINFDIFITGYYFLDQGTCIMQSFVLSYSNLLYVFSKLLELAITIPGIYVSIKTIGSAEKITFMVHVFEYACRCNLIELHVHV